MSITIGRSATVTFNRCNLTIVSEYSMSAPPVEETPVGLVFNSTNNNQNWFVQGSSTFNMTVDWGDGDTQTFTSANNYNPTHTYSTPGDHAVNIIFNDPTLVTYLDISTGYGDNRLKGMTGLDILSSLESLILTGNIITNFDNGISSLSSSVQTVDLSYNSLTSFAPTSLPQGLTNLYLNNNSLTSFTPSIVFPQNLINLYLNNNSITNFNPSHPIPNVQTLNLSYNSLASFSPYQPLPTSLQTLDLSYNSLTSFAPTGSFPNNTSYLYLNNNNMSSTDVGNALIYLSGSSTNWTAPNNIVLFNQAVGACVTNPSTAYSASQYLVSQGWTVDYDLC